MWGDKPVAALVGNLPNFYQQGATVLVILSVAQPVFIGTDQTALYNATLLVTKGKSLSYDSSSAGVLTSPLSYPLITLTDLSYAFVLPLIYP